MAETIFQIKLMCFFKVKYTSFDLYLCKPHYGYVSLFIYLFIVRHLKIIKYLKYSLFFMLCL